MLARHQPSAASARTSAAASASTASGTTVIVERPPPGLLRGRFAVQPWVIGLLLGLVVLLVVGFYGTRLRRKLKP
ncbi:MAG TPA: hypothetical protein VFQ61_31325 [Polyangiaceae bacterium]|nr:hypothetical protein [Polyangiaceae bacterium]